VVSLICTLSIFAATSTNNNTFSSSYLSSSLTFFTLAMSANTDFRGPPKTNPGGKWYIRDHTIVSRSAGSLCVAILCDESVLCMMFCPLRTEFIYQDPVTNKLIGEDGCIYPASSMKEMKEPNKEKDIEALKAKYGPPATMQRD
jgi:hypothetical protein